MRKAGLREDGDPASQSYYSKHIKTLAKRRAAARRKARSSDAEPQQKVTMEMLFRHDALPSGSGASPTSAHGAGGLDSSGLGGRARARQGRGLKRELGALERKLHHMTDGSLIRSVEDVVYDAHDPPRFRLDSATLYQYVVEQSSLSHGRKVVVKYMLHPRACAMPHAVRFASARPSRCPRTCSVAAAAAGGVLAHALPLLPARLAGCAAAAAGQRVCHLRAHGAGAGPLPRRVLQGPCHPAHACACAGR